MVEDSVRPGADPREATASTAPSAVTDATLSRLACDHLLRAGRPIRSLLRDAGLPYSLVDRPETVGALQQASFLELAARELDDALLGFHLAKEVDGRIFGPFYYLLASSANLGEALRKQARYLPTVNSALRCETDKHASLFTLSVVMEGMDRALAGHEIAFWITFVVQLSRSLTTLDLMPARLAFRHGLQATGLEMGEHFRRRPEFGADADCVSFDEQMLDLPLMRSDPYLNAFLTEFHESRLLEGAGPSRTLATQVTDALAAHLAQGQGRLLTVAGEFGMSSRTLGRRLAEEGVTFRTILDQLRADLGTRYVSHTTMPLSQVAWRLGYKDPSAFIVAFKRWTGKTPSALRREARS